MAWQTGNFHFLPYLDSLWLFLVHSKARKLVDWSWCTHWLHVSCYKDSRFFVKHMSRLQWLQPWIVCIWNPKLGDCENVCFHIKSSKLRLFFTWAVPKKTEAWLNFCRAFFFGLIRIVQQNPSSLMSFVNFVWDSVRKKTGEFCDEFQEFHSLPGACLQWTYWNGRLLGNTWIREIHWSVFYVGTFSFEFIAHVLEKILGAESKWDICGMFLWHFVIFLCNLARGLFTMNAAYKKRGLTLPPRKNTVAWRPTL